MNSITCIIVEDEPVSQEILRRYIADYPQLELKAVCSNAIDASTELRKHSPDLIFLDITLPKISGLDFYKSLAHPPYVIFTTAYPEYAVSGFEVDAIDYLVKPFPFERFLKAVNKVHLLDRTKNDKPGFIMLTADKKIHKVSFDDIYYLEAMGDYVKVHTSDKTLIVHQTLQKLSEQLPANLFYRIHKSFLIALQRIEYIEGNMVIIQKLQIPIGQTYRTDFLTTLNKSK
jgi:DNA-binding LytR/AlgR family response regulator